MKKRFIIRKYIIAESAKEALEKEKKIDADECIIDSDWVSENKNFGFSDKKK